MPRQHQGSDERGTGRHRATGPATGKHSTGKRKPLIRARKGPPESSRPRRRWLRRALTFLLLGLVAAGAWLLWPLWELSGHFGAQAATLQPSRLYGRSTELAVGQLQDLKQLTAELEDLGYRAAGGDQPLTVGRYRLAGHTLSIFQHAFPTPRGPVGAAPLVVTFAGSASVRRVAALRWAEHDVPLALLEPPLLASYYGPKLVERRPVKLGEVAPELVHAVLAAEDDGYFHHSGLSFSGIVRAAWVNLMGGEVRQGGSTLTQQLVKNLFLSPDRTLSRKLREAALAVFVEARYDKQRILEAYLNEIYLGRSGPVQLVGVGAASWAYFGKQPAYLDLAEAATLAGLIRSPAGFSPLAHPERARQRRDQVLDRLAELKWLEPERIQAAKEQPLEVRERPLMARRAPYFAARVEAEATERFGLKNLADAGYTLLSTLNWRDQQLAEAALREGLAKLEKERRQKRKDDEQLQGALVSLDPRDGSIRAYVAGRDFARSQFDRVAQARRQAGSTFKPVVYVTAFEDGVAVPSSLVHDEPLQVRMAGRTWEPSNDDHLFKGDITVRQAVEESRNVPTARLALQVGLPPIVRTARAMGIASHLEPLPSLALGAFEVTPQELAGVYATLAAGGRRPSVHALTQVLDGTGAQVEGKPLPPPEQVLSPQAAYLMTFVLQGVFERGTARSARDTLSGHLAGKTGTTNGRRDNWFAGYSPERATVVWVGYDDNGRTRLSGSKAALPIWTQFTGAVRPAGGFAAFVPPPGVVTAVIDPLSGELATESCGEGVITEVFLEGQEPVTLCRLHYRPWRRLLDRLRGRGRP